ncbi:phage major capsid protein [Candidatus Fokinia crypta]|uniref:HK97 family phage capsid protein n=1 Tax=Candidatus Fokinia crypta TaxID=1920990 RepID=A0ABZ0UN99_9RICK|nr:phage major capsid protein [Candidatus Fokinia cryptica]WPX97599.1 HK97 family phage capsid protein [Candidatus Fokinia cryptica]
MNTENLQSNQQAIYHEKIANLENIQKDFAKKMSQIERLVQKNVTDNAVPVPRYTTSDSHLTSYMRYAKLEYDHKNANDYEIKGSPNAFIPKEEIKERLYSKVSALSPIHKLSKKVFTTTSVFEYIKPSTTQTAKWITNSDDNLNKNEITFQHHKIPVFDLETTSRTTQTMLDDLSFDVEEWFLNEVSMKFATIEEEAFLHGDGKTMPSGILNNKDIGTAEISISSLSIDHFIELFYSLEERFSQNATFIISPKVAKTLAKLKDSSGKYIIDSIPRNGITKLLNMNVVISQNMQRENINTILFGNFEEGYLIVERQEIRILRNPYIDQRCITFYVTRRLGGDVIQPTAFKKLKLLNK